jgi:predicted nucleic acid-binding protein
MYLIDTDVISELRKKHRADNGVLGFFQRFQVESDRCFISAITLGELRRGVELIRRRGDSQQAELLERWLMQVRLDFKSRVLPIDQDVAELWGKLRVPDATNSIDKLIASTALINTLTVVTRNVVHFHKTGVPVLNPFEA